MRRCFTLALALICLFALPVHAQFDSATVSGVVQDGTGGVLPGVDVTLTSAGTGVERPPSRPPMRRHGQIASQLHDSR